LDDNRKWLKEVFVVKVNKIKGKYIDGRISNNKRELVITSIFVFLEIEDTKDVAHAKQKSSSMGRPSKKFSECCDRGKRYKVQQLQELYPMEQIQAAAKRIQTTDPKKKYQKYMDLTKALAILMDAELSKHQYKVIRNALKDYGCDVFPPYYLLLEEKKKCYPEHVTITETSAKIELQSLMDHTAKRLIATKSQEDITTISSELTLVTKWGCDGSQQSQYHQKFTEDIEKDVSDTNLFMVSMVLLVLQSSTNERI